MPTPTLTVLPNLAEEIYSHIAPKEHAIEGATPKLSIAFLEMAMNHASLSPNGDQDKNNLSTALASLKQTIAEEPKEYPGAYSRSISEMWSKYNEKVGIAQSALVKLTEEFQAKYALVPGLNPILQRFQDNLEVGWATLGNLSPASRTRQTERRSAAHQKLQEELVALSKSKNPNPKFIQDMAPYAADCESAIELTMTISPLASDRTREILNKERRQAMAHLTLYLNEHIYNELSRVPLTLVQGNNKAGLTLMDKEKPKLTLIKGNRPKR